MEAVGDFEYNTKDLIGHGAFAVVYKGRYRAKPELPVAIKSITKKNLAKSQNLLGKEIKILKELAELHHENVVALLDCKETAHHVYLVMEYCNGGDLADYLHDKGTLSENTIRLFLRQIAGAMRALNAKGIVHRDLKPQNILLCHGPKPKPAPVDITLKIADFGFARFLQDGVMAATLCGSPMYMAPEVIMSLQYDAKADLWSIGTIVFQCLTGNAPFRAQTPQALKQFYEKTANLAPRIPSGTSPELYDLLSRLLKRNAKDRMDFDEFFSHPFLKRAAKLSSPMPVPSRRSASPEAASPLNNSPQCGSSPMSGNLPPSPHGWCGEVPCEDMAASPQESAAGVDAMTSPAPAEKSLQSSPEDQDFVMVPASLDEQQAADYIQCAVKWQTDDSGSTPAKKAASQLEGSPRPSYLPVRGSGSPAQRTEPIPVPSQKQAFQQIQRSGSSAQDSSPVLEGGQTTAMLPSPDEPPPCSPRLMQRERKDSTSSHSSELGRRTPDITNLSPPPVQFQIGTPPSGGRRRHWSGGSGGTPPSVRHALPPTVSGSPLRRQTLPATCGNANQLMNLATLTNANPLSPIMGSPTREGGGTGGTWNARDAALCGLDQCHNINTSILRAGATSPFGVRAMTLPDMNRRDNFPEQQECGIHRSGSACRLFEHGILRGNLGSEQAALGSYSPTSATAMMPFAGAVDWSLAQRAGSTGMLMGSSPGSAGSFPFGTSPPTGEMPTFVAPELPEETILEREHNETLAKLHFIQALVNCILELAKSKGRPVTAALTDSLVRKDLQGSSEQVTIMSEGYRRAEQLVLYMRAVQLLSSALGMSRHEVESNRLQPSSTVKAVLKSMRDALYCCVKECKQLASSGILQATGVDPHSSNITADRLLYNYAIEMCQSAAIEELFGNPEECFRRYQTAQILLHSLAQQVGNDSDKQLLNRYKDAVEKRLFVLQSQGLVYAYDST
uniref:Putative serine/threonine-protein kinase unc-51 n=1 Tax=Ornithodoros turicata TaxID=34597 RepID=A0A2R5LJ83_9ACAR